jgi:hypothetical protein
MFFRNCDGMRMLRCPECETADILQHLNREPEMVFDDPPYSPITVRLKLKRTIEEFLAVFDEERVDVRALWKAQFEADLKKWMERSRRSGQ